MVIEHLKINPKLLQPLNKTLDLLENDKRIEHIDSLLIDVEQTIEKTKNYAASKNIDFKTGLGQLVEGRQYIPQYYPGITSVAKNRRKHMSNNLEKLRDLSDEEITALLGHRVPGSDYPSTHPSLAEIGEPDCSIREVVAPTPGAAAGDRVRYSQFSDSMYNAPAVPYWRSYHAAINFRGVDPGTLSGRQSNEMRERDLEEYTKRQAETEMTDWGLAGLRGCTVHGHSLRLQEDGVMFDMLDRRRLEGGVIVSDKDQVGVPIDKKVNLGKPMSESEAAERTTIYRVNNVPFRSDKEVIEHVQKVWELRTKYGWIPKI